MSFRSQGDQATRQRPFIYNTTTPIEDQYVFRKDLEHCGDHFDNVSVPGGFGQHAVPSTTFQRLPAKKFAEHFAKDNSDKLFALMEIFSIEDAENFFIEEFGDPRNCSAETTPKTPKI